MTAAQLIRAMCGIRKNAHAFAPFAQWGYLAYLWENLD